MTDYGIEPRGGSRARIWIVTVVTAVGLALIVIALLGSSTGSASHAGGATPLEHLRIVASVPPLTWPVRELAPEAELTVLAGAGTSPHRMELTPSQHKAIAEADVVLLVGLGLDDAVRRAMESRPRSGRQVVVLEDSLDLAGVRVLPHVHAGVPDRGAVERGIHDPHAWLDPMVMRVFAGRVDAALARASRGTVTGAPLLQQRCDSIDRTYRVALSSLMQREMVCLHDAYGYLAERYGLSVVGVLQPDESGEISPGDLKRVVDAIRALRIGAIFVEPGATSPAAQRLADQTGVRILVLDPLGTGDWPGMMNSNLEVLLDGLSARSSVPPLEMPNSDSGDAAGP